MMVSQHPHGPPDFREGVAALRRLVGIAQTDTGQARRTAAFLLAWWNADHLGGFNFTDLWNVDDAIAEDMATVTGLLRRAHAYPDRFVPRAEIVRIIEQWRE